MQSRFNSAVEVATNILIGYTFNFFMNLAVLPRFGFELTMEKNFYLGLIYTGASIVRSYVIRRFFNRKVK